MNLLARRHHDTDPPVVDTDEIARTIAADAVDDALRRCVGRKRFTAAETAAIVADVREQLDEAILGPAVTRALDRASATPDDGAMVDGIRLTDALLDVRLAVRR